MVTVNPELTTSAGLSWTASDAGLLASTGSALAGDDMICGLRRCKKHVTGPQTTDLDRSRSGTVGAQKPGNHGGTGDNSPPS